MAAGTKVQLRLGDRVVSEALFRDAELRIGRMKENDLVINNLAVSRFHAVLRRVGVAIEIEDLGSENGTYLNGAPVRGTAVVPPAAEIGIGKHVLTIQAGGEVAPGLPRPAKSDAWDAGQTYFAPELAPRAVPAPALGTDEGSERSEAGAAEPLAPAVEGLAVELAVGVAIARAARPPAASFDLPDPDGRFAFGEDELLGVFSEDVPYLMPVVEFDVSAPEVEAAVGLQPVERGGETALFDFGASSDLGLSEPSLARADGARSGRVPGPPEALYAGLIVERGGRVERVVPFRGGELIVGRGASCDLVLGAAGISRRHARFVREAGEVRVLDLGSANGLRVNGEPATQRPLQVGDVVAIDDYTLTYVLDREPLDQAVRSAAGAPAGAATTGQVTVLQNAPLASIPERDLVVESDEEERPEELEKELEIVAELGTQPPREASSGAAASGWVVEVVLATEGLPKALRDALRELSAQELRLPAELRLRRR